MGLDRRTAYATPENSSPRRLPHVASQVTIPPQPPGSGQTLTRSPPRWISLFRNGWVVGSACVSCQATRTWSGQSDGLAVLMRGAGGSPGSQLTFAGNSLSASRSGGASVPTLCPPAEAAGLFCLLGTRARGALISRGFSGVGLAGSSP